jgi:UDPglucose 6-dehydrogenase
MTTLIFGKGFVGKATANIIKDEIVWHDPPQGHIVSDMTIIDRVIICVPTPAAANGLDHNSVYECLSFLSDNHWNGPIAIRSTCMIDALNDIQQQQFDIVYWPEFLREAHADKDSISPTQVILGGNPSGTFYWQSWLLSINHASKAKWVLTDVKTAALIKLGTNAALSAKVMMFNSIYEACKLSGADWETVRVGVGTDPRIGLGQTSVPGPDKSLGFGGKCLPKDTAALTSIIPNNLFMQGIINQNNILRK